MFKGKYKYRPNTRKLYEEHHKLDVAEGMHVHHTLPERLGGTHDVENLELLSHEDHAEAHLDLYERYGDPRDLCAYHMIQGHTAESRLVACSMGGKASQKAKRARGDLNGFQAFSLERRSEIASRAGSIGGTKQRDEELGIHGGSAEDRVEWARLGGLATVVRNGLNDPERQAARGRVGGKGNVGFKWYSDGERFHKYTKKMQMTESFADFIDRTKYKPGKRI